MNGVIILSLDSGMLLFSDYYHSSFGLQNEYLGIEPMQLSAFLYVVYTNSLEVAKFQETQQLINPDYKLTWSENSGDCKKSVRPIRFLSQGQVTLHFFEDFDTIVASKNRLLLVISVHSIFNHEFITRLSALIFKVYYDSSLSHGTDSIGLPRTIAVKQIKLHLKALRNDILLELLNTAHGYDEIFPKNITWISIFVPSGNSKSKHCSSFEEYNSTSIWSDWLTKQLTMQEVSIQHSSGIPLRNDKDDEPNTVDTLPPSFSHTINPIESTVVKTGISNNNFINTKENSKSLSSLAPPLSSREAKVSLRRGRWAFLRHLMEWTRTRTTESTEDNLVRLVHPPPSPSPFDILTPDSDNIDQSHMEPVGNKATLNDGGQTVVVATGGVNREKLKKKSASESCISPAPVPVLPFSTQSPVMRVSRHYHVVPVLVKSAQNSVSNTGSGFTSSSLQDKAVTINTTTTTMTFVESEQPPPLQIQQLLEKYPCIPSMHSSFSLFPLPHPEIKCTPFLPSPPPIPATTATATTTTPSSSSFLGTTRFTRRQVAGITSTSKGDTATPSPAPPASVLVPMSSESYDKYQDMSFSSPASSSSSSSSFLQFVEVEGVVIAWMAEGIHEHDDNDQVSDPMNDNSTARTNTQLPSPTPTPSSSTSSSGIKDIGKLRQLGCWSRLLLATVET